MLGYYAWSIRLGRKTYLAHYAYVVKGKLCDKIKLTLLLLSSLRVSLPMLATVGTRRKAIRFTKVDHSTEVA